MLKPLARTTWLFMLWLCCLPAVAAAPDMDQAKPFAEKKLVLQLSDADPAKQAMVLNVVSNLLKYYGPDRIDIEVVAFGPGLRLLYADNENAERIGRLATDSGVRFSACDNTLASLKRETGSEPELNKHAGHVEAGVVRLMDLVAQGYVLVRP